MPVFEFIDYWHWWVLAVALLILEMFSPAAFFIWIGLAAVIMGFVLLLADPSWQLQLVLFAVLSVVSVLAGRNWFRRNPIKSENPNLNRRGQALIGSVFEVDEAIVDGVGRIRVGDTTWKAHGPDTAKGARVRVIGVDSTVLQVESV